jgi:hypothetical protein
MIYFVLVYGYYYSEFIDHEMIILSSIDHCIEKIELFDYFDIWIYQLYSSNVRVKGYGRC